MHRGVLVLGLLALAIAACGRSSPAPAPAPQKPAVEGAGPEENRGVSVAGMPGMPSLRPVATSTKFGGGLPQPMPEPAPGGPGMPLTEAELKEKYDTALGEALGLLTDRKLAEALTAFETARSFKDDEVVRQAISKLKARIEQETAAERITSDIQAIFNDGKVEEAAKLAADALQQFGNTDSAPQLAKLAREANSVVSVQADNQKERFAKFKADHETAQKNSDLRGAVLALEQALQNGEDAELKKQLDEDRAKLTKYDELRARAAEQRRDPAQLEDAVNTLEEAAKQWNTPAVQQDKDDCLFALQNRRERLAVAEFELRGDVGLPQAGAFVADEILPAFKGKYDIVERGQLAKIVEQMKLENGLTDDELARQKVGQAAKVRYLVVGSITPVAGITVQARLVDVKTGLIIQTARIAAANQEELAQRLPQLGQVLTMTDDQKRDFEQQQQKEAPPVAVEVLKPDPSAAIPPPPDLPGDVPPPPIMPPQPKPPVQPANLQPDQFNNLPPPPPAGQALPVVVLPAEQEVVFRRRSAFVALELGDNLFRRGRFRDAMVHFEFCLNLFPEQRDIRLRVERCRPLLPPLDPVVIVAVPLIRPRVAIMDFLTFGDPLAVPPYLGPWSAENIAPYFSPQYEVVDRATLFWWMGRLGITYADVLNDPVARLYLGRALGVRYFLFGNLIQTASFDVSTYLVDAEYGFLASGARVHVRNALELKLRLGEIAWLTKMAPDDRLRIERDANVWDQILIEIREHQRLQRFAECVETCHRALKIRPNNIEVMVILHNAERQQQMRELAEARQRESQLQLQFLARVQPNQLLLARNAELARAQAELFAGSRADVDRQRFLGQRESAAGALVKQAQLAIQGKRFAAAIQFYESAAALAPSDATYRELALARAKAEETARANAAEAEAAREAALRQQRETELAQSRAQLEAERQRRAAEEAGRRRFFEDRDKAEYTRLMDQAQKLSAEGQVAQAVSAVQTAKRLRSTPEADRLVSQLLVDLAKANAERQGAAARADLERQLAAEREARVKAELEANANRQRYEQLVGRANKALQDREYDAAIQQFAEAKKIHATDAVLAGLQRAQSAQVEAAAKAEADRRKIDEQQRQIDGLKQRVADAEAALAAKNYEKSIALFREAKKVAPADAMILTGLTKAEQLRDQEAQLTRRTKDDAEKKAAFDKFVSSGKTNLDAKKYAAAAFALGEAVKLNPNDQQAKDLLADALAKSKADAAAHARAEKNAEQYQNLMRDGRRALANKQYDAAKQSFRAAKDLMPGDAAADSFLTEATNAKLAAQSAQVDEVRKRLEESRKSDALKAQLNKVRAALATGNVKDAQAAYREAAKLDPNNPDVVKALADVRKAQDAADAGASAMARDKQVKQLVADAKAALAAKRLLEAGKLLDQAAAVAPKDPAVVQAQSELKTAQATMTAADADLKTRQQTYRTAMQAARANLQLKKFDEASKSVAAALTAMPNDKDALALQQQVDQAKKDTAGAAAMEAKKQQYTRDMAAARAALQGKRYDDALKSIAAALAAMPNDKDALALQTEVEKAKKDAAAAMSAEADKKREFGRLMLQARTAMAGKKFDDAIKSYTAALALYPNDADAAKGLADAKKAAETKPTPMPKPALYTKQMDAGAALEKQGKFEQALTAFQAALRAVPGDQPASNKVDFCQAMVDGNKAMQFRKFPDAVKAFEAALKLFPDDQAAKQALQKAKTSK